jgi:hypothetical protein
MENETGGSYTTHGRDHGRIILKFTLEKQDGEEWTGKISLDQWRDVVNMVVNLRAP